MNIKKAKRGRNNKYIYERGQPRSMQAASKQESIARVAYIGSECSRVYRRVILMCTWNKKREKGHVIYIRLLANKFIEI